MITNLVRSCGLFGRLWLLNLCVVSFLTGFGGVVKARADGCFVWNEPKDISEPTQKAIIVYADGYEDLILQVKYEGPVDQFGWLVPVPNLPMVQKASMDCFYELSRYTQEQFSPYGGGRGVGGAKVIQMKTVGAYDVAVLSPKNADSLENWLDRNHFSFPKDQTSALDSYIKRRWYFVAIKIHIGGGIFNWLAKRRTQRQLASGELHPLRISFFSDHCVYPLKISSVNGKPSEVQVYVLSREPLIEKAMFDQKVPSVRKFSGLAISRSAVVYQLRCLGFVLRLHQEYARLGKPIALPLDQRVANEIRWFVPYKDLAPYALVTANELPVCSRQIPRLKGKQWWLTKQTWTFQPDVMRDLLFQPAIPVFINEMAKPDGYFAAENLVQFGTNAFPALLTAFQGTNLAARIYASPFLQRTRNQLILKDLSELLNDPHPQLRLWAAATAGWYRDPKFFQPLLNLSEKDKDSGVRYEAALALSYYCTRKSFPFFLKTLKSEDLNARASALFALRHEPIEMIPREKVLPLFRMTWMPAINLAFRTAWILGTVQHGTGISCQEAIPLLHNRLMHAQLLGLEVLRENANKQSIELAIPMLKDPVKRVRSAAERLLVLLTGQGFPVDQPDEWQTWWQANKINFVVRPHPEKVWLVDPNSRSDKVSSGLKK